MLIMDLFGLVCVRSSVDELYIIAVCCSISTTPLSSLMFVTTVMRKTCDCAMADVLHPPTLSSMIVACSYLSIVNIINQNKPNN